MTELLREAPASFYYALSMSGMEKGRLRIRLNQWREHALEDPWVKVRSSLIEERQIPYYTLSELYALSDLYFHANEQGVLRGSQPATLNLIARCQQAYLGYEHVRLRLFDLQEQTTHACQTALQFRSLPHVPHDQAITLLFPKDLRVLEEKTETYYYSPSEHSLLRSSQDRDLSLVVGNERLQLLRRIRLVPPFVLHDDELVTSLPREGMSAWEPGSWS